MIAETHVTTDKAPKYLKWLCRHFNIKAKADYDDQHGAIQFAFGTCEMQARPDALFIRVEANDADSFAQIKYVVGDHLERFGRKDSIRVTWLDQ